MKWHQTQLTLPAFSRGCHLITRHIVDALPEIADVNVGMLNVFIQHTSASLTLNENADPDVRGDLERHLNVMVPENSPHFQHTLEGPDDMPAHIKASLLGPSLMIPVANGRMALGTWQGIYLCEHRDHGGCRNLVLTLQGATEAKRPRLKGKVR